MNKLLFLIGLLAFAGCQNNDTKFVRKKVSNSETEVTWYYYSYITNASPDYVEIKKNDSVKIICEAVNVISDVKLGLNQVEIKLTLLEKRLPSSTVIFGSNFFGYKVLFDSTGTVNDLRLIPDAIKER
jgi:hypothetical protein